jgi:hypothetical protein
MSDRRTCGWLSFGSLLPAPQLLQECNDRRIQMPTVLHTRLYTATTFAALFFAMAWGNALAMVAVSAIVIGLLHVRGKFAQRGVLSPWLAAWPL